MLISYRLLKCFLLVVTLGFVSVNAFAAPGDEAGQKTANLTHTVVSGLNDWILTDVVSFPAGAVTIPGLSGEFPNGATLPADSAFYEVEIPTLSATNFSQSYVLSFLTTSTNPATSCTFYVSFTSPGVAVVTNTGPSCSSTINGVDVTLNLP